MNMIKAAVLVTVYFLMACTSPPEKHSNATTHEKKVSEIILPKDYIRVQGKDTAFTHFLQQLSFKKSDTVHLFNGKLKNRQDVQYRVLNIDVGPRDLQQCADAVIRIRAEYLYHAKRYEDIRFMFTNGEWARFTDYAEGYRAIVMNNSVRWVKKAAKSFSYETFREYLDLVFAYAGTASLDRQMRKINISDAEPGDVLLQTGDPYGHAVILLDVAVHKTTGKKIMLLAQSYMPAQDIHILRNLDHTELSPWYEITNDFIIRTPEWEFTIDNLKRF